VFATALATGRAGPLALIAGLVTGFTAVGVAVAAAGTFFGIDERTIRPIVAVLFIMIGAALMYSPLERKFSSLFAPIGATGATLATRAGAFGVVGQFAIGLLLGAVWSPCSGPSLGAAIGLAMLTGFDKRIETMLLDITPDWLVNLTTSI
jgi:cytochrome c biogenesis protein CcdA